MVSQRALTAIPRRIITLVGQPSIYEYLLIIFGIVQTLFIWTIKYDVYIKSLLTSDMALACNILWNTNFWDQWLYTDMLYFEHGYRSLLNFHFSPTFLLLVPIYHLFPSPVTLLVIQTMMPGITSALIYRLGVSVFNSKGSSQKRAFFHTEWLTDHRLLSCMISVAYLFHPFIRMATVGGVYGFQPDCMIPPLIISVVISLFEKKWWLYALLLSLLFGLKENMPLMGALLGLGLMAHKSYRKIGVVTLILSGSFLVVGVILLPYFTGLANKNVAIIARLSRETVLNNIGVVKPWGILLAFLPSILAPEILTLVVPEMLMYTVAGIRPFDWHVYPAISIFAIACIVGLCRLLYSTDLKPSWFWESNWAKKIVFLMTFLLLLAIPVVGGYQSYFVLKGLTDIDQEVNFETLHKIKDYVPLTGYLVTTSDLMVHFVNRPHLLSPTQHAHADFMLANVRYNGIKYRYGYDQRFIQELAGMVKKNAVDFVCAIRGDENYELILFKRTQK